MIALVLLACEGDQEGGKDKDGPDDTGTPVTEELPEICVDAPVVTYDNFGKGFVTEACQPCHASTTLDRHDAPDNIVFDTEQQVWIWSGTILEVATGEEPTMPPEGGVSDDDRYLLEVWLTCDEPG